MQFEREIKGILLMTLLAFAGIAIASTYWTVIGSSSITQRDDNPRLIEEVIRIQRGSIYDRENELLAHTVSDNGNPSRQYLYESTFSPLGYYSLRYGEGGVESAYNDDLNGIENIENFQDYFERNVLHIPPIGSDVQLTLDKDIQDMLVSAMEDHRGAGIVMNAETGNVLALASLPTFNPNNLDNEWDALIEAEGNPFFNRVLQGQYQPGGTIYTLWLAHAILTQYDTSQLIANATEEIAIDDTTQITCAIEPNQDNLSLIQAYYFGCPVPFTVYSRLASESVYIDLVETFALDNQISLVDFPIPEPITTTEAENVDISLQLLRDTLGQGDITVTPLHVAGILSAIANNGNAPTPNMQLGIRPPQTSEWLPANSSTQSIPMMTTATARQLRTIMQTNWQTIQTNSYEDILFVGANVTLSQSGDETQLWLIGFVRNEQAERVAFVVLLEDTKDIQQIIPIGQQLIQALIDEQQIQQP